MRREIARKLFENGVKEPKDLVLLTVDEIYQKISKVDEMNNKIGSVDSSPGLISIKTNENDVENENKNKDLLNIVKNIRREAKELTDNLAILEEYEEKATMNAQNNLED